MFYLLQANSTEKGISIFYQYGILGVFALILLVAVRYLFKYMQKQNEASMLDMRAQIAALQVKVDKKNEEYDSFLKNEYQHAIAINEKCVELLDDVKGIMHNHKQMFDKIVEKIR